MLVVKKNSPNFRKLRDDRDSCQFTVTISARRYLLIQPCTLTRFCIFHFSDRTNTFPANKRVLFVTLFNTRVRRFYPINSCVFNKAIIRKSHGLQWREVAKLCTRLTPDHRIILRVYVYNVGRTRQYLISNDRIRIDLGSSGNLGFIINVYHFGDTCNKTARDI